MLVSGSDSKDLLSVNYYYNGCCPVMKSAQMKLTVIVLQFCVA